MKIFFFLQKQRCATRVNHCLSQINGSPKESFLPFGWAGADCVDTEAGRTLGAGALADAGGQAARSCPPLRPSRLLCPWGFSRRGCCRGSPRPPPGALLDPATEPESPALQAILRQRAIQAGGKESFGLYFSCIVFNSTRNHLAFPLRSHLFSPFT